MRAPGPVSAVARPLEGMRVAVTRPAADAGELTDLLTRAGAVPVPAPLTRIVPPLDAAPLAAACASIEQYDWLIFTSANAVRAVARCRRGDARHARIAAVGSATAAAVHELLGRHPDVVPQRYSGAALIAAMAESASLRDARVLWPRAATPRDEVYRALAAEGAVLDDPVAYRTVPDPAAASELALRVTAGEIDVITFTAPSAVACFADAWSGPLPCRIAVLGPSTAGAARERGLPVHITADRPAISALVAALENPGDAAGGSAPGDTPEAAPDE